MTEGSNLNLAKYPVGQTITVTMRLRSSDKVSDY